MFCQYCAAQIPEGCKKCEKCGKSIESTPTAQYVPVVPIMQQTYYVQAPAPPKRIKPFSGAKIAIGVIAIVLCVVVWMNSCAVGVGNALAENGSVDSVGGFILSFFMLVAGIVGVSSRTSQVGAFISGALFLLGAFAGIVTSATTYEFLPFWSFITLCFGISFIVFGALHKTILSKQKFREE